MSDTESFESAARSYDNYTWIGRDGVKRAIDRLKAAHDREIAQARDPQRLRGTKPNTFDGAIEALREFRWQHATNDEDAIPYINAVKEMHDREIRDTAQQEYHRGFEDGTHSMDAEHRAVAMRLRALNFADGRCHDSLGEIAHAVYPEYRYVWTHGSALRDELVRLMGGVSDDTCGSQCCGACAAGDGRDSGEHEEVEHGRAAHDCGADFRGGGCGGDLYMAGVRITDELREFVDRNWPEILHETKTTKVYVLLAIADRIDAQFDRICQQQEAVLQSIIDEVIEERKSDRLRIEKLERQRDEARQECADLLDLLRDAVVDFKNASYSWDYGAIVSESITLETKCKELQAKLDAIRDSLDG